MTLKGSFTREDILESVLLDDGLRRLVARALRRRVRGLRDLLDGAVFYGRAWNMASKQAPVVEVPKLTNIEFDDNDKMIITGSAKIRTSPDQPMVENSFKLRTKIGTRENGQYIRLEEPEIALVLECPKAWERNIVSACKNFKLPIPKRPEPLYQFIPFVSLVLCFFSRSLKIAFQESAEESRSICWDYFFVDNILVHLRCLIFKER